MAEQVLAHCEECDPAMTYRYDIRESSEIRRNPPNGPNPERTICDVHREAFVIARDEIALVAPGQAERIMGLMAEAFDMGKRMSDKLFAYNRAGFAAHGLKRPPLQ